MRLAFPKSINPSREGERPREPRRGAMIAARPEPRPPRIVGSIKLAHSPLLALPRPATSPNVRGTVPDMHAFQLDALVAGMADRAWAEFLRVPSLSMGVYRLRAGQADGQRPHTEDEVYYVVAGRATFEVDGRETAARPGAVLFVEDRK